METREQYGTFEKYLIDNESDLMNEYRACEDERKGMYENPSFHDFCIGRWQWLS